MHTSKHIFVVIYVLAYLSNCVYVYKYVYVDVHMHTCVHMYMSCV